ncbi:UNKNOWN [Stylonychia lemnae]|uniref:FHA domain-containing protein n=1 Tax=Stylonychia lemnae TaxID=5949 RepID=A0A077ZPV3_STYLE|nr:UNKNOWN [Stylonychia lemnae]|eukprot:CDW71987.1 UNKNOWN [Stylonychia lemnae]
MDYKIIKQIFQELQEMGDKNLKIKQELLEVIDTNKNEYFKKMKKFENLLQKISQDQQHIKDIYDSDNDKEIINMIIKGEAHAKNFMELVENNLNVQKLDLSKIFRPDESLVYEELDQDKLQENLSKYSPQQRNAILVHTSEEYDLKLKFQEFLADLTDSLNEPLDLNLRPIRELCLGIQNIPKLALNQFNQSKIFFYQPDVTPIVQIDRDYSKQQDGLIMLKDIDEDIEIQKEQQKQLSSIAKKQPQNQSFSESKRKEIHFNFEPICRSIFMHINNKMPYLNYLNDTTKQALFVKIPKRTPVKLNENDAIYFSSDYFECFVVSKIENGPIDYTALRLENEINPRVCPSSDQQGKNSEIRMESIVDSITKVEKYNQIAEKPFIDLDFKGQEAENKLINIKSPNYIHLTQKTILVGRDRGESNPNMSDDKIIFSKNMKQISSKQAIIQFYEGKGWYLIDPSSSMGTYFYVKSFKNIGKANEISQNFRLINGMEIHQKGYSFSVNLRY